MRQLRSPPSHEQQQHPVSSSLSSEKSKNRLRKLAQNVGLTLALLLIQIVLYRGVTIPQIDDDETDEDESDVRNLLTDSSSKDAPFSSFTKVEEQEEGQEELLNGNTSMALPKGFRAIVGRARAYQDFCFHLNHSSTTNTKKASSFPHNNVTIDAKLPAHGILQVLASWKPSSASSTSPHESWKCQLPPETECQETQVTAVYMSHKADKLDLMVVNLQQKLLEPVWSALIKEIILVYNGPRSTLTTHRLGQKLIWLATQYPTRFRIFYALEQPGFSNHLMNRYHPMLNVTTKAILYYDDDGPFYLYNATVAAFELWKRHSNTQVGALGRMLDLSARQGMERFEKQQQGGRLSQYDQVMVSHCSDKNDKVEYNFKLFPSFGSHMVLPSSSFLHVNYMCFLWHPALTELRQFVASHPVFPDDMAVSLLVSQLSGRAPRTYPYRFRAKSSNNTATSKKFVSKSLATSSKNRSPRNVRLPSKVDDKVPSSTKTINETPLNTKAKKKPQATGTSKVSGKVSPSTSSANNKKKWINKQDSKPTTSVKRRRLGLVEDSEGVERMELYQNVDQMESFHNQDRQKRRRLLWDDVPKDVWSARRSHAANNLVGYFGSIHAGGVGWCWGTRYQKGIKSCDPELPEMGMLPWMNKDNTPKATCP